ncbi:uncharacterized protein LOC115102408 isoform X5 [Oncorhynchus nerka]|uniref:uncharacterized protein LOC115102408 isoform X5 n=1 Tax=Oncorhynchus nerka TaxID=8023 RepID=UPI0031B8AE0B
MYKRCLHVNVGWAVYMMASLVLSESLVIQVDCNEDISMKCDAIEDKSYRSITWYKLNNRTGIIRRSDDEKPQFYEFPRPARFGMKDSLVLPRVRPEDAGNYLCLIRANIGQTNRESKVTLSVSTGCSKHQEETWQGQTTAVSPDLNPIQHLWEILEWRLRQRFPPPSTIPPIEFRTDVESMPRRIEAVLAACGEPMHYRRVG